MNQRTKINLAIALSVLALAFAARADYGTADSALVTLDLRTDCSAPSVASADSVAVSLDLRNIARTSADSDAFTLDTTGTTPPQTGDLNCDGTVNESDVAAFVLALLDETAYSDAYPDCDWNRGDMNGDSLVDGLDIPGLVTLLVGP